MRLSIIFILIMILACQGQKQNSAKVKTALQDTEEIAIADTIDCNAEVCLQLRNHDTSGKTFEIYMINSVPVAGFQCDLSGIEIIDSNGGLLKENGYQTSNSAFRLLSFSMQAKLIPIGMGVLTEINYSNPSDEVCMTEIIFAGIGGAKLSTNAPECMKLN